MRTYLLFIACLLIAAMVSAQDTASVTWELSVNTTNSYVTTGGVYGALQTASDSYVVRDYGGTESSQRVYSSGGGLGFWPSETAVNMERYCEFTVSPRKGLSFQLTNVVLKLGNSGGSAKLRASIFYSLNNFETSTELVANLVLPSSALQEFSYNLTDSNLVIDSELPITIRVYPWLDGGVASGKYFNIKDVRLLGITTGQIIAELPKVTTVGITNISTQTAVFTGSVTDDGGVLLDSVGVVYSEWPNATLADNVLLAEPKVGLFSCTFENLTPDKTYYARTFAINEAGIAYSDEVTFKTLDKLYAPRVTTTAVTELRPNGAVAQGNVVFDGGLQVTLTGFCFGTQTSPTLNSTVVEVGEGLGAFSGYLPELTPETTYFVRAFAQNTVGVGYGDQIEFKTPAPMPDLNITVDKAGNGDYATLQEAFDAVPLNYTGKVNILVKKGLYAEKVLLEKGKINVHLVGEHRDSTIIQWDDYSGKVVDGVTLGTSTSYTVAIDADDFIAQNITFQNTSQAAQAVALRVKGDRMVFNQCNLLGFQDTYYTWGIGRVYHEDCYIEGTVDFIFGSSVAVFKNCEIRSLRNSTITAASTEEGFKFGYVFMECNLVADNITGASLGRPWRPYAQTVFMHTQMGGHISPAGWLEWSGNNNHLTAYYAEYQNSGAGYQPESRVSWSHQLTDEQAEAYTVANIFAKETAPKPYYYDWMPQFEPIVSSTPQGNRCPDGGLSLYPNPASGNVTLAFNLEQAAQVNMALYTVDGRYVMSLVNEFKTAGHQQITCNTEVLPAGIYLCQGWFNGKAHRVKLVVEP